MITILTNGTLITKEEAGHISKAGARVQVSIESADPGFMTVFAGRVASIKRLKVFGLYFRQEYATSRLFRLSHETVFVNPRALLN